MPSAWFNSGHVMIAPVKNYFLVVIGKGLQGSHHPRAVGKRQLPLFLWMRNQQRQVTDDKFDCCWGVEIVMTYNKTA